MNGQASFSIRGRNPDVLTCIANLSNDEVFTPPEFANRMLDMVADAWAENNSGADLWADSEVTFLDPFTKSGVFLREITSRLTYGLATKIPDVPERVNHILTKQVFGTLRRVLDNAEAMAAVERIEGWRALGDNIIETIINKSEKVKELKNQAKGNELTEKEKKQLTEEEKEYKSKRKLVQEKLIKFATRIPAFMYLTDFRENTLQDVITKLEPDLFLAITGLTVKDFHLLVRLKVFNTEQMNQAVFAFRRYEDASLRYTGIESHEGLTHYGLYDTVVGRE